METGHEKHDSAAMQTSTVETPRHHSQGREAEGEVGVKEGCVGLVHDVIGQRAFLMVSS